MKSFSGWFSLAGGTGGADAWYTQILADQHTDRKKLAGDRTGISWVADGGLVSVYEDAGNHCIVAGPARWLGEETADYDPRIAERFWKAYQDQGLMAFDHLRESTLVWISPTAGQAGLVAADRIGRTRVYHRRVGDTLLFSSSALDLAGGELPRASLDMQGLFNYIYFQVIPGPRTAFQEISVLPPASCLLAGDGGETIHSYWHLRYTEDLHGSGKEDMFRGQIERDIRRVYEPGITGAFLSGGLDSSTVSGMLARVAGDRKIDTFSIGFAESGYDEMEYARISAQRFSTNQHEYYVQPKDIVALIPKVAETYSEPFGNSSAIPAFYCASMAREQGIKLLLAGDGGDELFGGNERYKKQLVFEIYQKIPALLRKGLVNPLALNSLVGKLPLIRKVSRYVEQANIPLPDRFETYNTLHWIGLDKVLQQGFLEQVDSDDPIKHLRGIYAQADSSKSVNHMLGLDMRITLADNDLPKVDGMCKLAGMRVEYPLISDGMLEFSGRVPVADKVNTRDLRIFYKRALRDFLATETIKKEKHGFGLPVGQWMYSDKDYNELARTSLYGLAERGIARKEFVDEFFRDLLPQHQGFYGSFAWILLILDQWLETHKLAIN